MLVNNDVSRGGGSNSGLESKNGQSALGWKELKPASRKTKGRWRRRLFTFVTAVLLLTLIFAAVRAASVASSTDEQLTLSIGGQQSALLDLRQSVPISPYLNGVNVFPEQGSNSIDAISSGFMSYGPEVVNGLKSAGVSLLRFPGGSWGEQQTLTNHILSYQQLYDFSNLLSETGAQGMIQARISSPSDKFSKYTSLDLRADLAGSWVDFMNNPKSQWRAKNGYAKKQIHPVLLWSVGNEPDNLLNPDTGKPFTVADYVKDFIQFSIVMHQNDPQITVLGPELSQFDGIGVGPADSQGQLWMEGFLQGVASYEKAHNLPSKTMPFHLLDGVSFHAYPFLDGKTSPYVLMSSPQEWYYLLPQLRQTIRQIMGRDLPVAITEINATPSSAQHPSIGNEALWWADTLGTLMNEQADYVSYFSAQGVPQPYPLFTGDQAPQQTATYRVFQLFSHLQRNLIPLQVQHDPVDAFATVDNTRQTISIMFVNKSAGNQTAQISSLNQFFGFSPWQSQEVSIAGYSIVVITLHRNGGAQAYSYVVPTADTTAITPLKQTVCGSKYDPLAFATPC
ncbi:MAG TPA: hypothetical protein VGT44_20685 [Ktedonobacteraceae bacterium]|nr:hypothetical protein [Ktedonobacteraceae bacterium]